MILHRYFARRYAASFGTVAGAFALILVMFDLIEQSRTHADEAGATLGDILALTLLNTPAGLYEILPLLVILSSVGLFLSLARSSELVVTRAAGRSALRALLAPLAVVLAIGAAAIGVLNPIVAATSKQYEARADALEEAGRASVVTVGAGGLWLRQGGAGGQSVIRAERANLDGTVLSGVTFVTFAGDGAPERRIEAAEARLTEGAWVLVDAKTWPLAPDAVAEAEARRHDRLTVPSSLTPDQIRDSFGTPSSIPIWDLPRFIDRLEAAGFSARRHEVWFWTELAQPAFLLAMALVGAGFTMRPRRGGRTGLMVLLAVLLGFGLHFLRNFARVLGETGQIPLHFAVWAPPAVGIALALALLLHLEDG